MNAFPISSCAYCERCSYYRNGIDTETWLWDLVLVFLGCGKARFLRTQQQLLMQRLLLASLRFSLLGRVDSRAILAGQCLMNSPLRT